MPAPSHPRASEAAAPAAGAASPSSDQDRAAALSHSLAGITVLPPAGSLPEGALQLLKVGVKKLTISDLGKKGCLDHLKWGKVRAKNVRLEAGDDDALAARYKELAKGEYDVAKGDYLTKHALMSELRSEDVEITGHEVDERAVKPTFPRFVVMQDRGTSWAKDLAAGARYGELASQYKAGLNVLYGKSEELALPAIHEETIAEWSKLEEIKERARTGDRSIIEGILRKYAPRVNALIPGTKIVFRGSLARGVKSPKKFAWDADKGAPKLAMFDEPEYYEAKTTTALAQKHESASYDIDANLDIPTSAFHRLSLESGPITNSPSNETVQALIKIQGAIDTEIKEREDDLTGYDLSEDFEFFLNPAGKTEAQWRKGTPYPPFMLVNAGFPELAARYPRGRADELTRKVTEYAARIRYGAYLPPFDAWEEYFRDLYLHILDEGPVAVFMPEVQVEITSSGVEEYTTLPEGGVRVTGGEDPLDNYSWIAKRAKRRSDLKVGRAFEAKVLQVKKPSKGGKDFLIVSVGLARNSCVCFSYRGTKSVNDTFYARITSAPSRRGQSYVVQEL